MCNPINGVTLYAMDYKQRKCVLLSHLDHKNCQCKPSFLSSLPYIEDGEKKKMEEGMIPK